jgi:hypothetical protein
LKGRSKELKKAKKELILVYILMRPMKKRPNISFAKLSLDEDAFMNTCDSFSVGIKNTGLKKGLINECFSLTYCKFFNSDGYRQFYEKKAKTSNL